MQFDILNREQKKVGTVDLPEAVFGVEVNEAVLWEQVKAQRASRRRGTHKTKTRDQVSGTGAKPFKQKGTGRARQGSNRSPNHVGGGTVFGPRPRDYSYELPKSARRAALRSALSLRVSESAFVVLEEFSMDAPKTQTVDAYTASLGTKSVLVVDKDNSELKLSARNLKKTKYLAAEGLNVYDILDHEKLVITKAALDDVVAKAAKLPRRNAEEGQTESA